MSHVLNMNRSFFLEIGRENLNLSPQYIAMVSLPNSNLPSSNFLFRVLSFNNLTLMSFYTLGNYCHACCPSIPVRTYLSTLICRFWLNRGPSQGLSMHPPRWGANKSLCKHNQSRMAYIMKSQSTSCDFLLPLELQDLPSFRHPRVSRTSQGTLKGLGTSCRRQNTNANRFPLNLHSLKIMIVESFP